ncbi:LysE family translocator [Acinetobacter sp. WCHAc060042]|uniref:LysE family translocator n=1 Tax=Acinetobacter sp. WCHAc060042 TaxID=2213016 RepID=UPI000DA6AF71|nr:LysE family translocator [Acinetobacter sp. WCHAc060042]
MELFIIIAVTHFVALLSPGPDFFLILLTFLKSGRKMARYTVLGIVTGNALILILIFILLCWLGYIHPYVLMLLRGLGIVYLTYLAWQCLGYAQKEKIKIDENIQPSPQVRGACFFRGLQSSLLNPKNMLFYSSLILLVYSKFNVVQLLCISLWMVGIVLIWNLLLLKLFSLNHWNQYLTRQLGWLYKVSGLCFAIFAIILFIDGLI